MSAYCSRNVSGYGSSTFTRSRNASIPSIRSSFRSSNIDAPFCVMKHRIAMNICAMSATGMRRRVPGRFTHHVLWPSMYGSSAGMFMRPSASLRIRDRCASITAAASTGAPGSRSTSFGASRVSNRYTPESSVKNSSDVWNPAAEGNVRPPAAPE